MLQQAAEAIQNEEVVIFPTETVYGLGASVFSEKALRQIFALKKRPADNPLIVHIDSLEEAHRLSAELGDDFFRLAEAFWPGPLTLVVSRRAEVPDVVSAGLPTIAIRMPSHPIARELIRLAGVPIAAPSANLSGNPSPTNLQDALEDLNVAHAIDGGSCSIGIESTVLALVTETPTLLRPGHISKEALEKVLGKTIADAPKHGPILSPGMKYRHYAPKAKVELVYKQPAGEYFIPTERNLYAELRKADRRGDSLIVIYCDETVQKNVALMNRLLKASG